MSPIVSQSYPDNYAGLILKRSFLVLIVVLFFCDIAIYLSLAVSARIEPQYWIALFLVLGGILAWFSPQMRWQVFRTPLFFWCVLFFALTVIFFFAVPTSYIEQLKERFRDVVLLISFLGVFLIAKDEVAFIRKVVFLAVLAGTVINLVSLVHMGFLSPPGVTGAYQPGGLYINPNESGSALVIGMTLSLGVLPRRWREIFALFVLIGVVSTFSRESILGWLIVVFAFSIFQIISWRRISLYTLGVVSFGVVVILLLIRNDMVRVAVSNFYHLQLERLSWFIGGSGASGSNDMRIRVLEAGWQLFSEHPLTGGGIGSTYHWSLPVSTHNMYLLYMDDYGIIGAFLYPLLIWCMIRKAAGEIRKLVWTMAIFLLFWGLFDHNIVQNYYSLFAISLTAAMSKISADEASKQMAPISAEAVSG